jgi:hypothetical protein
VTYVAARLAETDGDSFHLNVLQLCQLRDDADAQLAHGGCVMKRRDTTIENCHPCRENRVGTVL